MGDSARSLRNETDAAERDRRYNEELVFGKSAPSQSSSGEDMQLIATGDVNFGPKDPPRIEVNVPKPDPPPAAPVPPPPFWTPWRAAGAGILGTLLASGAGLGAFEFFTDPPPVEIPEPPPDTTSTIRPFVGDAPPIP